MGYIRNRKPEEKIIQNRKTAKNSAKTENRIQNRQNGDKWGMQSKIYRGIYLGPIHMEVGKPGKVRYPTSGYSKRKLAFTYYIYNPAALW